MGSNRLISNEEVEKSKVEFISLSKMFEELCPIYMGYGMSYDEYWYDDCYKAKYYRETYEIQIKHNDEQFWMQGMYIYDALCRVSPILHAFSKKGTKPLQYRSKPMLETSTDLQTEKEKAKAKEIRQKNEQLKARIFFENWARRTAEHFNK